MVAVRHINWLIFIVLAVLNTNVQAQAQALSGIVINVHDGDTLTVLIDGHPQKIRLTEIDTPEANQPWGQQAKQALIRKVLHQTVTVQTTSQDRYGRSLGRVYLGPRDINRELVTEGHAWAYRKYLTDPQFITAENQAQTQQLGLWSLKNAIAPWDWRRGRRDTLQTVATAEPAIASTHSSDNPQCGNKRYCRDMTSCAEARFYLQSCGLTRLDSDQDGEPCESLCPP